MLIRCFEKRLTKTNEVEAEGRDNRRETRQDTCMNNKGKGTRNDNGSNTKKETMQSKHKNTHPFHAPVQAPVALPGLTKKWPSYSIA
jgi:hypothetical protein